MLDYGSTKPSGRGGKLSSNMADGRVDSAHCIRSIGGSSWLDYIAARYHTDYDMAALRRFFTRRGISVAELVTWRRCPYTNPDEAQFSAVRSDGALQGEFELPTAGDVAWLLFSYT